jgi:hypothetical protein
MVQKQYRTKIRPNIVKALYKTATELAEPFRVVNIRFDELTKEFVVVVDASDNFHAKLITYLH